MFSFLKLLLQITPIILTVGLIAEVYFLPDFGMNEIHPLVPVGVTFALMAAYMIPNFIITQKKQLVAPLGFSLETHISHWPFTALAVILFDALVRQGITFGFEGWFSLSIVAFFVLIDCTIMPAVYARRLLNTDETYHMKQ